MEHFTTLFLDIGGVLMTNGWDRQARRRAADIFSLDYAELNERHHLTFDTYEEGKLSLDDYLDRVVFSQDRSFSREEFRAYMFDQSRIFPDMIELVCKLKTQYRLKVAGVNNEGRELNEHRMRTFGLGRIFDFFVSSCFVHFRKPDPDIYRIALDIAQVMPEQVVYIDDRPMFVEVARSSSIQGIVHTGFETTREELKALGLALGNQLQQPDKGDGVCRSA